MSFARVKALGWALFETLTSSQMTQLDIDHSKATDSTYVKDYGAACTFPIFTAAATWTRREALIYLPVQGFWLGATLAGAQYSANGYVVTASSTFPSGLSVSLLSNAIAHDQSSVLLVGSQEASGNLSLRRTTDYKTWAKVATSGAAISITTLQWWPSKGLFISGALGGQVETSPDGLTWTSCTVPDSNLRGSIAVNSNIAVIITSAANTCITSPDGVTWTQRTLPSPSASGYAGVNYSDVDGVFLACSGDGTKIAKSVDGITWTAVTPTYSSLMGAPISMFKMKTVNNLWISIIQNASFNGLSASFDVGATWRALLSLPNGINALAAYNGQVAVASSDGVYFSSKLSMI